MVQVIVDFKGVECAVDEGGGEGPEEGAGVCYVCFARIVVSLNSV